MALSPWEDDGVRETGPLVSHLAALADYLRSSDTYMEYGVPEDLAAAILADPQGLIDALVEAGVLHEESDCPLYTGGPEKTYAIGED